MRFATAALAAAVLALGASSAQAQERITLTGRVVDAAQQPVVGASVKLKGGMMVFTDRDGRFFLARVPVGAQLLEVRQLGFEDLDAALQLTAETKQVELTLRTNPVLLESIDVMVDRLADRRRSLATTVSAYGLEELARSPSMHMVDFLRRSTSAQLSECGRGGRDWCVYKRGRTVTPEVWIDERPAYGGIRELEGYAPQMIHSVEIIGGTHIRVYTQRFAHLLAERKVPLMPVIAGAMVR